MSPPDGLPPPGCEPLPRGPRKVRGTFLLPRDLLEELRDAAYWARQSLARIAERALRRELVELQQNHNQGHRFERRPAA